VVHSHSHAIVPLSIVKDFRMKAVFHMAGFVGQDVPIYEIREAGGDATDLLVSNNDLGRALAEKFDASDIVLMRGHGSTVVGDGIQRAVYRAIYAELNARYLMDAAKLGEVVYLTEGESRAAVANVEAQVQRPWDLWVDQARARRANL
jgi:ribulose-5-phosphate 4-epimerase/fuculose-1-phosphate aldolase